MSVNPSFNFTCFVVEWVTVIASCLFVFFGHLVCAIFINFHGPWAARLPIRFLRLGQDFRAVRQWDGDWKVRWFYLGSSSSHELSYSYDLYIRCVQVRVFLDVFGVYCLQLLSDTLGCKEYI